MFVSNIKTFITIVLLQNQTVIDLSASRWPGELQPRGKKKPDKFRKIVKNILSEQRHPWKNTALLACSKREVHPTEKKKKKG